MDTLFRIFNWRLPTYREVIVNTKSNQTFRGVFVKRAGQYIFLKRVQLMSESTSAVSLDGEVLIPVDNVDFIQVI